MIKDPFYTSILDGLRKKLDPETFEHCAADLLRTEWPTLVPVPGGTDSGVDGIAALPKGPLLVTTTQQSVIENLKKSLKSYVKSGGNLRAAIVATSQELTPQRRKNLEKAALKAKFRLRQIYTRQAIANRLYPNKLWCQELLGLTGDPGALSLFPVTSRPLIGNTLVGREADLQWLLKTSGDLLIVGQPGSGKTFLMHEAARQAGGLFVVDDDLGRIAADLRAKSPRFVVVDDAHVRVKLVMKLRGLKQETGGKFRILANCWPGDRESARRALDIGASSVRELELLSRDDIVEVLKLAGVSEPLGLIHELVNQADGRPGLAVTLSRLWLRGEVDALASADALFEDVHHTFTPLVGSHATTVLAVFALGGDWGMRFDVVAPYLRMSIAELHAAVVRLAAGGVLTDIAGERLSVRPAPLRHALVRDVFFSGGKSPSVRPLLDSVPNIEETTHTLIGARARGAPVPDELLQQLLQSSRSPGLWSAFVRLGPAEAKWTLTEHPHLLGSVGDAALDVWPSGVLPLLLSAGAGDTSNPRMDSAHPLHLISRWTDSGVPGTGEAVLRRQQVIDEVLVWLKAGEDVDVAVQAVSAALSPGFEDVLPSPGSTRSILMRSGLLLPSELDALKEMWARVFPVLFERQPAKWTPLFGLLHDWLFPMKGPLDIPPKMRDSMSAFALQMGQDLASVAANRPGVLHMLVKTFARTEHEPFQVQIDADFSILYPVREFGADLHAELTVQAEAARALGVRWVTEAPDLVARRLVNFEREAAMAGITWPRLSPEVCAQIARSTEQPLVWAEALRERGAGGDLLYPFLKRLADLSDDKAEDFIRGSLDASGLRRAAVAAVIEAEHPLPELLELSLGRLENMADWVETWAVRGTVKELILDRLLRHPDSPISGAAAGGLWHKDRAEAAKHKGWREAVVTSTSERDYNLEEIFRAYPDISFDWLTARMRANADVFWRRSHLVETAVSVLNVEQRRAVLKEVVAEVWTHDLIASIVANDADLYRALLQDTRLRNYHLSPLHSQPDDKWVSKALEALAAGYTPEQIAKAALGSVSGFSGLESATWGEWMDRFEWLKERPDDEIKTDGAAKPDDAIRTIGKIGSELARVEKERALVSERADAVHGYD